MIKIAIIEDEVNMLQVIKKYLEQIIKDKFDMEIITFMDAETFLNQTNNGQNIDILLCDIELPGINGIELGNAIKNSAPNLYLIYLTSHAQFAMQSYQLDAYQYVMKEEIQSRLPLILNKLYMKILSEQKKFRVLVNNNEKNVIYYKNVISVTKEKGAKYVLYKTFDGEYRERITMDELVKQLNSFEFIVVERGYIVNMRHIAKLKGKTIWLDNGDQVIISRARMTQVKNTINTYWGRS